MTLIKLAGLSILMTLAFQSTHTLEETFLTPENNKDNGIKTPEKRTNNFRVPMETTFDPNFWPARGRRSRRDPEREPQQENCVTSTLDKTGFRCQPAAYEGIQADRRAAQDFEPYSPLEVDDDPSVDRPEKCYGSAVPPKPNPRGRLGMKISDFLRANLITKGYDDMRRKKQRHTGLPQLVLYGNGVYWEPENLYEEKKKKQDVFWVARGKKNINFPEK